MVSLMEIPYTATVFQRFLGEKVSEQPEYNISMIISFKETAKNSVVNCEIMISILPFDMCSGIT